MTRKQQSDPFALMQPRTHRGLLRGRPRGDGALLAVLTVDTWTPVTVIADRLGLTVPATHQRLYRARKRGTVENQTCKGWRRAPGFGVAKVPGKLLGRGHQIAAPYELLIRDLDEWGACTPPNGCATCLAVTSPNDREGLRRLLG